MLRILTLWLQIFGGAVLCMGIAALVFFIGISFGEFLDTVEREHGFRTCIASLIILIGIASFGVSVLGYLLWGWGIV